MGIYHFFFPECDSIHNVNYLNFHSYLSICKQMKDVYFNHQNNKDHKMIASLENSRNLYDRYDIYIFDGNYFYVYFCNNIYVNFDDDESDSEDNKLIVNCKIFDIINDKEIMYINDYNQKYQRNYSTYEGEDFHKLDNDDDRNKFLQNKYDFNLKLKESYQLSDNEIYLLFN